MDNIEDNNRIEESQKRVSFESDSYSQNSYTFSNRPKIVDYIIRYSGGLIKDEDIAVYVLYGFVIIMIIISISLSTRGNKENLQKNLTPLLIEAEQMPKNK